MDTSKKQYGIDDYAEELIHHKARQMVGNAGFTADDIEDIEQEMRLDLLQRLPKFDPSKATYKTFVSRLVERQISDMIRHSEQEGRDYRREESSLQDAAEFGGDGDEAMERIETVSQDEQDHRFGRQIRSEQERHELRLDIPVALSKLPPDLRELAELLQTMSIAQAARELGIPRTTLYYSRLPQLRQAFRAMGLDGNSR